jgi:hypothetical protein
MSDELRQSIIATRISTLWHELALPGTPGKSCPCPFHKDSSPSFSIFTCRRDGRDKWKCHAGCGQGDALDFLLKVTGADRSTCIQSIKEKAFTGYSRQPIAPSRINHTKPHLALDLGTRDELNYLSKLRGIPLEALDLAHDRNILRFAYEAGERAWVVTDVTGINAQVRPLRPGTWKMGVKAKTLKDSRANHPVGLPELEYCDRIFVTEGGPDLLAAHAVILWASKADIMNYNSTAAVGFLGAGLNPSSQDLEKFEGKKVIIFSHSDKSGLLAARRWIDAFSAYCRSVNNIICSDILSEHKDLNDIVSNPEGKNAILKKLEECHG